MIDFFEPPMSWSKEEWLPSYPAANPGVPATKDAIILEAEQKLAGRPLVERKARTLARSLLAGAFQASMDPRHFRPSDELISIVARGRYALVGSASQRSRPTLVRIVRQLTLEDEQSIGHDITTRIERLFGSFGDEAQDASLEYVLIATDREFDPSVEFALADAFAEVRPSDLAQLLKLLRREIRGFINAGGRLAGDWGTMRAQDRQLVLAIGETPFTPERSDTASHAEPMGIFVPR